MKTLLISGSQPLPDPLRELIAKGSTSLHERPANETNTSAGLDADGLAANEMFSWPRDEDRLRMAFMTGA